MPPELMELSKVLGAIWTLLYTAWFFSHCLYKVFKWLTLKRTKKGQE